MSRFQRIYKISPKVPVSLSTPSLPFPLLLLFPLSLSSSYLMTDRHFFLPPSLVIAYSSLPDSASPEFEDTSSSDAPAATPAWGASAWGESSEPPSAEGSELEPDKAGGSDSGETVRESGGEDSGYLSPSRSQELKLPEKERDEELEGWKNEEGLLKGLKSGLSDGMARLGLGGGGKTQGGW